MKLRPEIMFFKNKFNEGEVLEKILIESRASSSLDPSMCSIVYLLCKKVMGEISWIAINRGINLAIHGSTDIP